jgi:hypothetical protein
MSPAVSTPSCAPTRPEAVPPRLFHVSEEPAIGRFEPRPPPSADAGVEGLAVWAIAESHLANYLLPRDCPRICFRAGAATTPEDRARFLGGAGHVVAFEAAWLSRVRAARLFVYALPPADFAPALPEAGYWIARRAVTPLGVERLDDALGALASRGVEVRVLPRFWPLAHAVAASSLEYSIIRKRNAEPDGLEAEAAPHEGLGDHGRSGPERPGKDADKG